MYSSSSFCLKAALPVCHPFRFHGKRCAYRVDQHKEQGNTISRSRVLCCQPIEDDGADAKRTRKDGSDEKPPSPSSFFRSLGKELKDALSPKPKGKGDWKDLVLMSLSFAVYVYMSQKIVCAYCAYMSSFHTGGGAAW